MKGIRVDPESRDRARAGRACCSASSTARPRQFGLAVPSGIVTHTGVAGLTLGGGIGWIMRKYGLTIDKLLSVDVVTADGEFVKASEDENADLFWGVRGGGGNFGIVTEFEFRAEPLGPHVVAGPVFWPMEDAAGGAALLPRLDRRLPRRADDDRRATPARRRCRSCPRTWSASWSSRWSPATPVRSRTASASCAPLKAFGSPVLDLCLPKPYLAHQQMFDPSFQHGWWYYVRSCDVAELNDDVIDIVVEHGMRITSPITSVALWQMGGAVARVGEDETAFNGRQAGHTFNINGNSMTADGFDAEREWARDYWSALAPHHTSVYVNFLMEEGEERVRQAYGAAKYDRLKALKRKYDPTNFFRLNQNIKPD